MCIPSYIYGYLYIAMLEVAMLEETMYKCVMYTDTLLYIFY